VRPEKNTNNPEKIKLRCGNSHGIDWNSNFSFSYMCLSCIWRLYSSIHMCNYFCLHELRHITFFAALLLD